MPSEEADTQERQLLGPIAAIVGGGALWIADRNFCGRGFRQAIIEEGQAIVLLRQHPHLPLNSEINAPAHPQAAVFAFVLCNIRMLVHAALGATSGETNIAEEFSNYCVADETAAIQNEMIISNPGVHRSVFAQTSLTAFATVLHALAPNNRLERFKKNGRGPKKPRKTPSTEPTHPHLSTAWPISARQ